MGGGAGEGRWGAEGHAGEGKHRVVSGEREWGGTEIRGDARDWRRTGGCGGGTTRLGRERRELLGPAGGNTRTDILGASWGLLQLGPEIGENGDSVSGVLCLSGVYFSVYLSSSDCTCFSGCIPAL